MKIIYFDGVCGLCNGFVDFILKIDRKKIFKFSPLQGAYASAQLPKYLTEDLSSVVVSINGRVYTKAEAVTKILIEIGGLWSSIKIVSLFPLFLQNNAYDFIARHRYRIFGKKSSCRIPTDEEKERFVI